MILLNHLLVWYLADILIISPSSLSYVAALISDGEIYYKPFWHKPRKIGLYVIKYKYYNYNYNYYIFFI